MERKSTFGHIVLFGLITGILMVLLSLVFYLMDLEQKSWINMFIYVILIIGMSWGMINIRENRLNGVMSYGKAVGTGFWIGFVAAIVVAVYTYYYMTDINPEAVKQALEEAENNIIENKPDISDEDLDKMLEMVRVFGKPSISAIAQVFTNSIISIILALIIAIFAKREDRTIA